MHKIYSFLWDLEDQWDGSDQQGNLVSLEEEKEGGEVKEKRRRGEETKEKRGKKKWRKDKGRDRGREK